MQSPRRPLGPLTPGARRAISRSREGWVTTGALHEGQAIPLLVRPAVDGLDLAEWATDSREQILGLLNTHGALLFRGFGTDGIAGFERAVRALSGDLLEYRERSSPRSAISGNIYTSTEHPADQSIFLHNENSYASSFPLEIFFFCVTPPQLRGETPIADCSKIYQRIAPAISARFAERGVMYLRNFGDGFGLPWQTAFQTDDPAQVEAFCQAGDIQCEWKSGNRLRTRAVRPAVVRHPRSGATLWFNQAALFHVSSLEPAVRAALLSEFAENDLPLNAYYGDGAPIEDEVVEHLRQAHHAETISFPWQQGDLLMLDNMLVSHGRAPFEGPRKIAVAMTDPISWGALAAPAE